ncbi:MAG: MraY family glycosyltransferase [Anaerolineae bacterium]|nr:undecaprenyl/decaprenyl-phosphate alpha-N-acetylglucosaminyl 1-phosphate transferase [Anaerolineales bacterium]MCQ3978560.1 undecaprenyl/decaprenyl-phosphate alpha-N-acetylglucosaminyl 1-phosphate transferase [Anaerolineae bacterium]
MTAIMLIFVTALFFGSVGTPLVRKLAINSGFIAMPKADRAHTEPTALMGGLAIYGAAIGAWLLITLVAVLLPVNIPGLPEFAAILTGASFMAAVGLWDDRHALPPRVKLAAQVAPIVLVFLMGVRVSLPLLSFGEWNTVINFIITAAWILYITNAVNFLDNADGIAVMTSATTSAIFLLIAILNGQQLVSILAAAVMGASLGFARYNLPFPHSTIFMGDSGSLFLGFLLAVLGIKIRIPSNDIQITWMVPIVVLGLPIFDTAMVFISRTRRGVSFFQGGIDHTTHRLARLGLDKLSVALAVTVICGALGWVAIFITQATLAEAYSIAVVLLLIALYALWRIEFKASYNFRTGRTPVKVETETGKL